nr:immunoglobulin heavy chain junction region [Mus musculus]
CVRDRDDGYYRFAYW